MSSPRLAWYPWFTGDWLAQTRGWCVTARGVARELLDVQWDRGCLPADPEELRTLISASRREWEIAWPVIESLFPAGPAGRQNRALEEEREKAMALVAARKRAAAAGHAARWGNRGPKVVRMRRDGGDDA
jgi:uncharacterized protein YdaU (DUF1376 family)